MSGQNSSSTVSSTTVDLSIFFPPEPEKEWEEIVRATSLKELRTQEASLPNGVRKLFWKIEQSNDQKKRNVFLTRTMLRGLCRGDGLLTAIAIALASREHGFEVV